MNSRKKIIIIAPNTDATDVGESRSNYYWTKGISQHHDVTLLTYYKRSRGIPIHLC